MSPKSIFYRLTVIVVICLSCGFATALRGLALDGSGIKSELAGLQIEIWSPPKSNSPAPLVIFSHGFRGSMNQSAYIMEAMAKDGYIVIAPDHKDSFSHGNVMNKPDEDFVNANAWSEKTYKNRGEDIKNLLDALHKSKEWNSRIDWSKVALAGHSLGGYTVLALAGAWPGWKIPDVKAVVAFSPYCAPLRLNGDLKDLNLPVMYQGGTRDRGITPTLKGPHGAYAKTSAPAYFVEFEGLSHFGWTNFNRDQKQKDLVTHYTLSFLDKYVKNDSSSDPRKVLPGVSELDSK